MHGKVPCSIQESNSGVKFVISREGFISLASRREMIHD